MRFSTPLITLSLAGLCFAMAPRLHAQQVTLPLPRLLTLMPMGGQAGTDIEVALTAENAEDIRELAFSNPKITARPVSGKDGQPVPNKFSVHIPADIPAGVYDARLLTRLGVSSARAFSVGLLPEVTRSKPNNTLETALPLAVDTVCNATMTKRAVDFYSFKGVKGQRVAVDCSAAGIDSRLTPVLIIANGQGQDIKVSRTGGPLDFTPPVDGTYIIKVNDLTFQGGERHFYRLALRGAPGETPVPGQPQTQTVSAMSWPPTGLAPEAPAKEAEPNNAHDKAQKISLPCDIAGSFFPAADVDTYEFTATKGDVWWVEVASERLGLDTDPFVLVQQVGKTGEKETLTDVAELYDIAPPMKVSSNGYSYDGPPYNAGSPDVNGKFEVKETGTYRLQIRDLFGGTRNEPGNIYRLIVRKAAPDFSLAAWAVHMTLRNGDRAALSKPLALRSGDSRVLEVVVQRRDGFDGDIELSMDGLPPGVSASGLKIAKGKQFGHMVLTAAPGSKTAFSITRLSGTAMIDGHPVTRPCRLASMEWAVKDAKGEIPAPRLMADIPVSVTDSESAPVFVEAAEDKVWEARAGETLRIPLKLGWSNEFTGTSLKLKAYGEGFATLKEIDIPIKAATTELVIDLAALKTAPGDHALALYGTAVSKYRYNPAAVPLAEAGQKKAAELAAAAAEEARKTAATDANAAKVAAEKQKQAEALMTEMTQKMKSATAAAEPKDTVDIIVSRPIRLKVMPAGSATTAASRP